MATKQRSDGAARPDLPAILYLASLLILGALTLAGIVSSLTSEARIPTLRFDYSDDHDRMLREKPLPQILPELRVAAIVDFDRTETLVRLYVAAKRAGNIEGSILAMRRLLSQSPDDAALHNELAQTLFVTGNAAQALVHSQRAVELNPESEQYRDLLDSIRKALGKETTTTGDRQPSDSFAAEKL